MKKEDPVIYCKQYQCNSNWIHTSVAEVKVNNGSEIQWIQRIQRIWYCKSLKHELGSCSRCGSILVSYTGDNLFEI